jgi:hypothetical protein
MIKTLEKSQHTQASQNVVVNEESPFEVHKVA